MILYQQRSEKEREKYELNDTNKQQVYRNLHGYNFEFQL